MLGILGNIRINAIALANRSSDKRHRLRNPLVRLGATKPQKPRPCRAETLAAQAHHAELVVCSFEQVQRQTVRSDANALRRGIESGSNCKS